MNRSRLLMNKGVSSAFILLVFVFTACSTPGGAQKAATPVPTTDVNQITQAVLAEVESKLEARESAALSADDTDDITEAVAAQVQAQLANQVATAVPDVEIDEIVQSVLAEVDARLAGQIASAVPEIDVNAITQSVLAQVEARLDEQRARAPVVDATTGASAAAEALEQALIGVYERANPAVVHIVTSIGSGSGFVFSTDGYIVTNNHVIENGSSYEVVFYNGERRSARLTGADVDSDLAVIKVDGLPAGVHPAPLAEADDVEVGQLVVAIGNPFGEQGSMSLGIISGLGRSLQSQRETTSGSYSLPQVIQTDAPINPGNSGGPLLNLAAQVIGVNSAIASRTGTNSGVGFSIPVAAVRQVVPSLVEKGEYVYPYMGASFANEISLDDQSSLDLDQTQGAYVLGVTPNGPADKAGLISANPTTGLGGDLIVQIDDQPISNFSDLNGYLVFHTSAGQTIQITVLRGGERVIVPLTLGARP